MLFSFIYYPYTSLFNVLFPVLNIGPGPGPHSGMGGPRPGMGGPMGGPQMRPDMGGPPMHPEMGGSRPEMVDPRGLGPRSSQPGLHGVPGGPGGPAPVPRMPQGLSAVGFKLVQHDLILDGWLCLLYTTYKQRERERG